jgi:hypothetical protein
VVSYPLSYKSNCRELAPNCRAPKSAGAIVPTWANQTGTSPATAANGSPPRKNPPAYESIWERLPDALTRVMETSGLTQRDAQADTCRAIADRAVRVQAKLGRHPLRRITSKDTVLEGRELQISTSLKPDELDWQGSRPLIPWLVLRGAPVRHGHWDLEWIKVCKADVTNFLCGASVPGTSAQPVQDEQLTVDRNRPGAKEIGRPRDRKAQKPSVAGLPRRCGRRPTKLSATK